MDLPSCPQEMLASVLRYSTLETVTRLRKINKQMDYVAVKYRLNLPKVYTFDVENYGRENAELVVEYRIKNIWDYKRTKFDLPIRLKPTLSYDQSTILNVFEEFIKKIRPTRCMMFSDGDIDENFINMLQNLQMREKVPILFINCNFTVPVEKITPVLAKYPNSEMRITSPNQIMNEPLGRDEILMALIPHASVYYEWRGNRKHRPAFTDETLLVARRWLPRAFQIGCESPFSLSEVKKTMLRVVECFEPRNTYKTEWNFGHLFFDSTEELKSAANELAAVPRTTIVVQNADYACITFKYALLHEVIQVYLELR